jgi:hypothetical protein
MEPRHLRVGMELVVEAKTGVSVAHQGSQKGIPFNSFPIGPAKRLSNDQGKLERVTSSTGQHYKMITVDSLENKF